MPLPGLQIRVEMTRICSSRKKQDPDPRGKCKSAPINEKKRVWIRPRKKTRVQIKISLIEGFWIGVVRLNVDSFPSFFEFRIRILADLPDSQPCFLCHYRLNSHGTLVTSCRLKPNKCRIENCIITFYYICLFKGFTLSYDIFLFLKIWIVVLT